MYQCINSSFNFPTVALPLAIKGNVISPSVSVKDPGIIIDRKFKFHTHTAAVTAKANGTLTVIHKSFHFISNNMFINLYNLLLSMETLDQYSIE